MTEIEPTAGPEAIVETSWYTTEEVAELLKVDASSLRRWRTARPPQGPPFVQISGRVTRYFGADVVAYLRNRRVDPAAA
ncbi:helix-turn-helix domain-containing protein [Nocardia sp. CA2R105]|uniref:helix-turn-helix domain-containing protein n=1 Tax=Nocardia coffeae TaxID=2873381 RepID=UPI001CA6CB20|nr:helix-turn-helix domain-containing protein [Nocardia coffeae]MBY8861129.1 helix-turn-helix domain-containing protein [Nocardia coffeae]